MWLGTSESKALNIVKVGFTKEVHRGKWRSSAFVTCIIGINVLMFECMKQEHWLLYFTFVTFHSTIIYVLIGIY